MTVEIIRLISTLLPLIWLGYALISRIVRPHIACIISLLITGIASITVWRISADILLWSILDGVIFSLFP
ncbi:MAG TPA: hypothetical protein P5310_01660, partial [bacterium]|nr:hypothetical protein [bacterium]